MEIDRMKLYKFGLNNRTIISLPVELPSGTKLVLRQGQSHVTDDEIDGIFASKLTGIQMMNPLQSEIVKHLESLPQVPTVEKELTKEQAMQYLWHDVNEEYVIEELLKRGYICKSAGAEPEAISQAKLALKFTKVTDKDLMEEAARRGLVKLSEPLLDPVILEYLGVDAVGSSRTEHLLSLHYTKVQLIAKHFNLEWVGNTKDMIEKIVSNSMEV